jgi:hypothetical protein
MRIWQACKASVRFADDTVRGKWRVWGILIIYSLIFPLILGYMMEIYRGSKSPPGLSDRRRLFEDGLGYFAVRILYSIPLAVLMFVLVVVMVMPGLTLGHNLTSTTGMEGSLPGNSPVLSPRILMNLVMAALAGYYVLSIPETIGIIRYARTDVFEEAFHLEVIREKIGRIGWAFYLGALLVPVLILGILTSFALFVNLSFPFFPFVGSLLAAVAGPLVSIFNARFLTLVYDTAP